MAYKFIVLAALVAVAQAGVPVGYQAGPVYSQQAYAAPVYSQQAYAAPVYSQPAYATPVVAKVATPVIAKVAAPVIQKTIYAEPEAPAHYNFEYSVHDEHTGDIKSQQESREGDVVRGSYSLIDADGYKRIVEYTADAHSGFNAVVRREPIQGYVKAVAPVVAKVAAPVYAASPVVAKVAAPVYSASPVVAKVAAPVYSAAPVVSKVAVPAYNAYASPAAPAHYYH